jgi:hypothetical protein
MCIRKTEININLVSKLFSSKSINTYHKVRLCIICWPTHKSLVPCSQCYWIWLVSYSHSIWCVTFCINILHVRYTLIWDPGIHFKTFRATKKLWQTQLLAHKMKREQFKNHNVINNGKVAKINARFEYCPQLRIAIFILDLLQWFLDFELNFESLTWLWSLHEWRLPSLWRLSTC